MSDYHYDVLVIGTGPAGEGAAMAAVKQGMRVGAIENRGVVGGNCSHKGTIPSKALRHVVKQIIRFNQNNLFHHMGESTRVSYPKVLKSAKTVIPKQVDLHTGFYNRNRVYLHIGEASFSDDNEVRVRLPDGAVETIRAKHIVVATGSRPYRPADVNFNHPRVYDSDTILEMNHTPRHIVIYGAGVIGSEYASIFAGLGIKVDLINSRERLLSFLDDEISDALSYHLRDSGVTVRHLEEYEKVEANERSVTLHLKSGKRLRADALLWCNGRTGNTDNLNLDAVGLEADHRGQLKVNDRYQTDVEYVYAAGDVIGWPSLASASYDQGREIAMAINGEECRFVTDAPTGIYTLPEISSLGKTERELTEARVPYEVGRAFFKNTARAQISGEDVGMLKLLFHIDTHEILGIHCFGAEASEIIHIGQAIMNQEGEANNINYFVNTTFNYPTMAEAYRTAALEGLNRVNRL
ncbi:Si-specific NAD(P)(+) transhydrogenase [Pseudoteredinibacter isoporae]|uniref:Si-specific NAD(P)(+) transhydrogenase n=1 Tax=Pseudoteredinibacter isoporae TaxID=570281 RepID=UPI00310BB24D